MKRLVYIDCKFCKGTGKILDKTCNDCKGEGQIPVEVSESQYRKAIKENEAIEQNYAFCNFIEKLRKKQEISNEMFVMLRKAFDLGIKYKEKH